jgi:hypothetical protein
MDCQARPAESTSSGGGQWCAIARVFRRKVLSCAPSAGVAVFRPPLTTRIGKPQLATAN